MNSVTGTKQYSSVVVPYRPGRKRMYVCVVAILLFSVSALSYWLGSHTLKDDIEKLRLTNEQLSEQLNNVELRREELSQNLANASLGAEVDREAVNEIRATVREHQQTIASLNEEIGFYKGLMAPTDREKGLGVRSWELYATNDPNRFQFKLIAQQLAHKHQLLKGNIEVNIVGKLEEQEQTLALSALSEQVKNQKIKLRFKYFQSFDGELQLPEGFEPDHVEIVAKSTTPKSVKIERRYGWIVQK